VPNYQRKNLKEVSSKSTLSAASRVRDILKSYPSMSRTIWMAASAAVLVMAVAAANAGCKKAQSPPSRNADLAALSGVNCRDVQPPTDPELMAWEPSSRTMLDRLRRQGVVAVRYEANGCDVSLELLPQCVGPRNRYVYSPLKASASHVAHDVTELFAQLPLGAANVSGLLKDNHALRTDFMVVGSVALPEGSTITEYDLVGPECRRATHVINALYVGGFAMAATKNNHSSASLFGIAIAPGTEGITREGYAAICERAATEKIELEGCSVPLRVSLLSLHVDAKDGKLSSPSRCMTGFFFDGTRCVAGTQPKPTAASTQCHSTHDPACTTGGSSSGGTAHSNGSLPDGGKPVFDQNAVERIVRQRQAGVRRTCWETAPESMKRISVSVTTRIDTQGKVEKADPQILDSEGPTDVASVISRCIANDIRSWQFPEPESEKVLTLPFHLIRQ
jgi:hypothetical protein